MSKMFKVLEIIWLILGIIGILLCGYFIIMKDNQSAIYFIIFTVICGVMYSIRKRQRLRFEGNQKKQ
jgi:hypothetical protein